jgi:hypothetical protein
MMVRTAPWAVFGVAALVAALALACAGEDAADGGGQGRRGPAGDA